MSGQLVLTVEEAGQRLDKWLADMQAGRTQDRKVAGHYDALTAGILLKDIEDNFKEKTVIITAHRFSSVVNCDEILYMRDGEITERGTFKELMALGGSFAHVYNVQQQQQASVVDYDSLAEKSGGK